MNCGELKAIDVREGSADRQCVSCIMTFGLAERSDLKPVKDHIEERRKCKQCTRGAERTFDSLDIV